MLIAWKYELGLFQARENKIEKKKTTTRKKKQSTLCANVDVIGEQTRRYQFTAN